jgi:hypothetical protein
MNFWIYRDEDYYKSTHLIEAFTHQCIKDAMSNPKLKEIVNKFVSDINDLNSSIKDIIITIPKIMIFIFLLSGAEGKTEAFLKSTHCPEIIRFGSNADNGFTFIHSKYLISAAKESIEDNDDKFIKELIQYIRRISNQKRFIRDPIDAKILDDSRSIWLQSTKSDQALYESITKTGLFYLTPEDEKTFPHTSRYKVSLKSTGLYIISCHKAASEDKVLTRVIGEIVGNVGSRETNFIINEVIYDVPVLMELALLKTGSADKVKEYLEHSYPIEALRATPECSLDPQYNLIIGKFVNMIGCPNLNIKHLIHIIHTINTLKSKSIKIEPPKETELPKEMELPKEIKSSKTVKLCKKLELFNESKFLYRVDDPSKKREELPKEKRELPEGCKRRCGNIIKTSVEVVNPRRYKFKREELDNKSVDDKRLIEPKFVESKEISERIISGIAGTHYKEKQKIFCKPITWIEEHVIKLLNYIRNYDNIKSIYLRYHNKIHNITNNDTDTDIIARVDSLNLGIDAIAGIIWLSFVIDRPIERIRKYLREIDAFNPFHIPPDYPGFPNSSECAKSLYNFMLLYHDNSNNFINKDNIFINTLAEIFKD